MTTQINTLEDALLAYAEWWITPDVGGCLKYIGDEGWQELMNFGDELDTIRTTRTNEESSWYCLLLWAMLQAEATEATANTDTNTQE